MDVVEFRGRRLIRARTPKQCDRCERPIDVGEYYLKKRVVLKSWDDLDMVGFDDYTCQSCIKAELSWT